MSVPKLTPSAMAIVDWLAELGPRWGLPSDACRVHALLYLFARPVSQADLSAVLDLDTTDMTNALHWLSEDGLAVETPNGWTTQNDPWSVIMQALNARREREIEPAREVLGVWKHGQHGDDHIVARQVKRLHDLVEDIAAIDASARRLSPESVRKLVGIGGRTARFLDRTFGGGTKK